MIRKIIIAFVTSFSFSAVQAQTTQEQPGADLIVINAKIFTGSRAQPEASALAVKKGRIYSVGSDVEILGLTDSNTEIIDAHSRRLIPGIIDAHIHVLNDMAYNYNVRWDGVPTLRRALAMLSEQAARTPEGQWVKVIGGWSPYQFEENRFPTLDELRNAVPDRWRRLAWVPIGSQRCRTPNSRRTAVETPPVSSTAILGCFSPSRAWCRSPVSTKK
jgi:hypothetical protein